MAVREYLRFYSELGVTHLRLPGPLLASQLLAPPATPAEAPSSNSLEGLRSEIGDCRRCRLAERRTQIVFGSGNAKAQLMFVGEGPGEEEDLQGVPFVGKAGQLLTRIIEAINLRRDQVYIANVVKCRPPCNRNPESDEIAACRDYLFRQIECVGPRLIVALGKFAAQVLFGSEVPITRLRGKFFDFRGIAVMPTFHPSYLLHNPGAKREVWEDMKTVRDRLKEMGSEYYR